MAEHDKTPEEQAAEERARRDTRGAATGAAHPAADPGAAERNAGLREAQERDAFTPEQLATPPSCPPLVGGYGPEAPEAAEQREAEGRPAPEPFRLPGDQAEHVDRGGAGGRPPQRQAQPAAAVPRR